MKSRFENPDESKPSRFERAADFVVRHFVRPSVEEEIIEANGIIDFTKDQQLQSLETEEQRALREAGRDAFFINPATGMMVNPRPKKNSK